MLFFNKGMTLVVAVGLHYIDTHNVHRVYGEWKFMEYLEVGFRRLTIRVSFDPS